MFKKFIIRLVTLSIIISLAGCTGGIITPPQDDDNSQVFQYNMEIITNHVEQIAESGKAPEQYAQELAALLANEENVSKVEVFGNFVNITYNIGKVHTIIFTDKEPGDDDYPLSGGSLSFMPDQKIIPIEESKTILPNRSYTVQREVSDTIPLEQQTIGIQDFSKGDQSRSTTEEEKIAANRNILYWCPNLIVALLRYPIYKKDLIGGGSLGFDLDLMTEGWCSIDSLKEITNYGMVIIDTHGSGFGFQTGEEWTVEKAKKYEWDDNIFEITIYQLKDTYPFYEKRPTYFGVYYSWFSENIPENNSNTIVLSDTCSNGNSYWWDFAFKGRAGCYFGWDDVALSGCGEDVTRNLLVALKSGVYNTQEAYDVPYYCYTGPESGANWVMFGDPVRFATDEEDFITLNAWTITGYDPYCIMIFDDEYIPNRSIFVYWSKISNAEGYKVYRSVNGSNSFDLVYSGDGIFHDALNIGAEEIGWFDFNTNPGNSYSYKVSYVKNGQESTPSKIITRSVWLPECSLKSPTDYNPEDPNDQPVIDPNQLLQWNSVNISYYPYQGKIFSGMTEIWVCYYDTPYPVVGQAKNIWIESFNNLITSSVCFNPNNADTPLIPGADHIYVWETKAVGYDNAGEVIAMSWSGARHFFYMGPRAF